MEAHLAYHKEESALKFGKSTFNDIAFLMALVLGLAAVISFWPSRASAAGPVAGTFEVTGLFGFTKSDYGGGNYEMTRRWNASFGYHLTETSEIEATFQDVVDRTIIAGFEDTTFHDRIYGVDWVQGFTGKDVPFQPFVKGGIGQLDRTASGSYAGGASPPLVDDQFTVLVGVGIRVYFSHTFALRAEVDDYLTNGSISTYTQNVNANFGFSLFF
jgi:hypothetical protein